MHTNKLNILYVGREAEIPRMIGMVYHSLPHQLKIIRHADFLPELSSQEQYDLLIIGKLDEPVSAAMLKKVQLLHNHLNVILIDQEYHLDEWLDVRRLNFMTQDELINRLPLVLSEIYSDISYKAMHGLNYWRLIRAGLDESAAFMAIVTDESKIMYLNRSAESKLGIENTDYMGALLTDFISDGSKVWKYLTDQLTIKNVPVEHYPVRFLDIHNQEYEDEITIKKIEFEEPYLLIQSEVRAPHRRNQINGEYRILNKFADSIANELLNPVNIISGRLQLLQAELSGQEHLQKSLATLEKQVNRTNEIISNLLTFARLKQDTIPQKIQINEIVQHLLLDPSIMRIIKEGNLSLDYDFSRELPVLSGLISHFDLLFKTIIELSHHCLGANGGIIIRTRSSEQSDGQPWAEIHFTLSYEAPLSESNERMLKYLGAHESLRQVKSLQSTIISHIIRQYQGLYQVRATDDNIEEIKISFPSTASLLHNGG